MEIPNYQNHSTLSRSILGFANYARTNDLIVGIRESEEAMVAATLGLITNRNSFKYALRSIFCCSQDDVATFDRLFANYWGAPKASVQYKAWYYNSNVVRKSQSSLVFMGVGDGTQPDEGEAKNVSGAHKMERLRKTDFSKVAEIDSAYLEALATNLWKQMSRRLKKKLKNSNYKGRIDIRKTIRSNISKGGSMLELKLKAKAPYKNKLVILLDVSGSMDKYSFYLLRFVLALRVHFQKIEAFVFSTKLIRITDYLRGKDLNQVLTHLSSHTNNWSSGTKIGECIKTFNDHYGKRILNGRSITIVLSDGLDTGEPELLTGELHKIKLRTRKLIWLNPLKGMEGYQPTAQGMKAALPEIDVFRSAHNLESILELEDFLAHV